MFLIILLICALSVLVYLKLIQPLNYWKNKGVSHIPPYPIVGNMGAIALRKKPFGDFFKGIYDEFPNDRYVGIFSMMKPSLVIRDPDLVSQMCVKEFEFFNNRAATIDKKDDSFFAKILVNLQDKEWKEMRSTLSPVFTSSKMKAMYFLIQECAANVTNYFLNLNQKPIISLEMKEVFSKFSNDVIASVAFGVKCNSLKDPNNPFYIMGRKLTAPSFFRGIKILLTSFFPQIQKLFGFKIFPDDITSFFKDTVKNNMLEREEKNIIRQDLIHLLMEAKKGNLKYEASNAISEEGFAVVDESNIGKEQSTKTVLTDEDCACQAMLFFFAGFETVSVTSAFMAHELAVNPDVQKKLQNEIDAAYNKTDLISYEQLLKMKYLDQVVTETLRLWPAAPQTDRKCSKPFTIQPIKPNEKPLVIEKGCPLTIPIMGFHRDPEYFPNPEKFDPERFSDENKHNIKSNAYMPFGVGPHNCIGSRLGLLEVKILFVNLLRKFDIVVIEKTAIKLKMDPNSFSLLPKGGFWLGLQLRK